jgi:hypothetical protein
MARGDTMIPAVGGPRLTRATLTYLTEPADPAARFLLSACDPAAIRAWVLERWQARGGALCSASPASPGQIHPAACRPTTLGRLEGVSRVVRVVICNHERR